MKSLLPPIVRRPHKRTLADRIGRNGRRELHATPDRWRIASGTRHDVERVLAAFGVVREYGDPA